MSDQIWSNERIAAEVYDYALGYQAHHALKRMRDEYEARIAELEQQLAVANAWRTVEDEEVWLRLPDEAGGIL